MQRRYVCFVLALVFLFVAASCRTPAGRTTGEVVSDSSITTEVKTKLLADRTLSGLAISVETFEGNVTLTGAVPSNDQKKKAEEIAKNSKGVKKVNNLLMIKPM